MGDLYYVGDTVSLSFEVSIEDIAPIKVETIIVSVFSEEGEIIHEDPVTILEGVVRYEIDPAMTKHAGDYSALFEMTFTGGQKKTYQMPFSILPRGVSSKEGSTRVGKLTKDATDNEVEAAIREDLRALRKGGGTPEENSKLIFEIAQRKLGRRLPRY